jgi:KaiC/GvpD/RAD55 family RecA-like ATPase
MKVNEVFFNKLFELGEAGYQEVLKSGLDPEKHLDDDARPIWLWVKEQRQQHGVMPTKWLVEAQFGTTFVETTNDQLGRLLELLFNKRLIEVITTGLKDVVNYLDKKNVIGCLDGFSTLQKKLRDEKNTAASVESIYSNVDQMMKNYDDMESGKRGIPTPWQSMDTHTNGWYPEDLILLVARPGTGKTWASIVIADVAFKHDKRILFVTTEMSSVDILTRLVCLQNKISYTSFMAGRLDSFTKQKLKEAMDNFNNEDKNRFLIAGNRFNFTIEGLEAAVEMAQPDLLIVDGAYLIKNKGKDRQERVANTFDDLKRIAKQSKSTCIANTQFNRSAASKKDEEGIAMENIGITDVASWNSDAVYAFWKTKEMETSGIMGINALKVRRNRPSDFKINWNMDNMNFSEIADPTAATFSAPVFENKPTFGVPNADGKADYDDSGPSEDTLEDDMPF